MKAGEALRGPHTKTRLGTLEELAKRVGDVELKESISAALRLHMARSRGVAANPLDVQRLDLLIEWERRRIA